MTDLIARWRYRIAAALLRDQWYVPPSDAEKVWIVMQHQPITTWFPVETLDLTAELNSPALGDPARPRRVGTFSGTIADMPA